MSAGARGFTLMELLIVLAILSILAVLALPAYTGYRLRANIAEGIDLALPIKYHALEAYQIDGVFPEDNASVGLGAPATYGSDVVAGIGYSTGGVIRVEYSLPELGANRVLELAPCVSGSGPVEWVCRSASSAGIDPAHLPSSCRNLGASCASGTGAAATANPGPGASGGAGQSGSAPASGNSGSAGNSGGASNNNGKGTKKGP